MIFSDNTFGKAMLRIVLRTFAGTDTLTWLCIIDGSMHGYEMFGAAERRIALCFVARCDIAKHL